MHILLSEPDPAYREELYKAFRKRGWKVSTAGSAAQSAALLQQAGFDAAVMNADFTPGENAPVPSKCIFLIREEASLTGFSDAVTLVGTPVEVAKKVIEALNRKAN